MSAAGIFAGYAGAALPQSLLFVPIAAWIMRRGKKFVISGTAIGQALLFTWLSVGLFTWLVTDVIFLTMLVAPLVFSVGWLSILRRPAPAPAA